MMGRQRRDQCKLFYEFHLDDRIPKNHLLRRIDVIVTAALADLHKELDPHYSAIGRPSIDPELMLRMAHRRLLLRHPLRAPAHTGGRAAPRLPLVLQARP
jgi:transposase